jgi:putative transposase
MGRIGSAHDNSLGEGFVATLKSEPLYRGRWPTREAARMVIFEQMEGYYNRRRIHSSLGYRSPVDYEKDRMRETTAA